MALRLRRRLGEIYRVLPRLVSGNVLIQSSRALYLASLRLESSQLDRTIDTRIEWRSCNGRRRYSTAPKRSRKTRQGVDMLSYIASTLNELGGPSHCWFNRVEYQKKLFRREGVFLILAGEFVGESSMFNSDIVHMIENVKLLQQRNPSLQVMGFQYSHSVCSATASARLLQRIMMEYISFPVLLSNNNFAQLQDGACYFVFKDFQNPSIYHEKDVDLVSLDKAVKDLHMQDKSRVEDKLKSSWMVPSETFKEPHLSYSLCNLLTYFPGCISVDENGSRLFLSDANHHRIIVFDIDGKIVDCIGSSPGFEDGKFESAKLLRPAASFYDDSEDCLYFVDSENHAIRRADMERRVVETSYPNATKKHNSFWGWIQEKLWIKKEVDAESKEVNGNSLLFPWHLMKSSHNDLYVLTRSLRMLWVVDVASGLVKEFVKGPEKISKICGPEILQKLLLLKQLPTDLLLQQVDGTCSLDGIPYAGLISSVATFGNHTIVCDTVGQTVLKVNQDSGKVSSFQFSNLGTLGFPYWFSFPLERVYASVDALSTTQIDHVECFRSKPGKVDLQLNVDIPHDTDLVEPLEECCIWRQARGAAIEVSGVERIAEPSEKVGVAQQWYDEIDSLTSSSAQEIESKGQEESTAGSGEHMFRSRGDPEKRIRINCTVSASPGISEVIIYAVLYLKLKGNSGSNEKKLARLAELLNATGRVTKDSVVGLFLKSNKAAEEYIFMRPLHVRVKLECGDHEKADNTKSVRLAETSLEVNVSLH